jgi:hypothetical protein
VLCVEEDKCQEEFGLQNILAAVSSPPAAVFPRLFKKKSATF